MTRGSWFYLSKVERKIKGKPCQTLKELDMPWFASPPKRVNQRRLSAFINTIPIGPGYDEVVPPQSWFSDERYFFAVANFFSHPQGCQGCSHRSNWMILEWFAPKNTFWLALAASGVPLEVSGTTSSFPVTCLVVTTASGSGNTSIRNSRIR